jgi:hypothetical protein
MTGRASWALSVSLGWSVNKPCAFNIISWPALNPCSGRLAVSEAHPNMLMLDIHHDNKRMLFSLLYNVESKKLLFVFLGSVSHNFADFLA